VERRVGRGTAAVAGEGVPRVTLYGDDAGEQSQLVITFDSIHDQDMHIHIQIPGGAIMDSTGYVHRHLCSPLSAISSPSSVP
jgi:hypothetical protein